MHRRDAVGLALLLVLTAVVGLPGAASDNVSPVTTPQGFDNSAFQIHVFENGTAEWTVRHSRPLYNESQVATFREFMDAFNAENPEVATRFRTRAQRMVDGAEAALDRPMNASAFHHRARIENLGQTRGVVELSFIWTNFARQTDRGVVVDDVFGGGMYILDNQRLVVQHGPEVAFVDVSPTPTSMEVPSNLTASSSVTWEGERQFADSRPHVRLASPSVAASAGQDGSQGAATDSDTPTETPAEGGGMGPLLVFVVLVVALGVAGGAIWYVGGLRWLPEADTGPGGAAAPEPPQQASREPTEPDESAVPEGELLSDEDRVLALLEENDGRMKQVKIVEETDWSKSKVSMLLSEMDEADQISKLRVGRENIISLAGNEPEAAGSPFEEE